MFVLALLLSELLVYNVGTVPTQGDVNKLGHFRHVRPMELNLLLRSLAVARRRDTFVAPTLHHTSFGRAAALFDDSCDFYCRLGRNVRLLHNGDVCLGALFDDYMQDLLFTKGEPVTFDDEAAEWRHTRDAILTSFRSFYAHALPAPTADDASSLQLDSLPYERLAPAFNETLSSLCAKLRATLCAEPLRAGVRGQALSGASLVDLVHNYVHRLAVRETVRAQQLLAARS